LPPGTGFQPGLPTTEDDMLSYGVGRRVHRSGRLGSIYIAVHTYAGKIVLEPRFHECAHCRFTRVARRPERFLNGRRKLPFAFDAVAALG
jgi:hypothetical protein